MTWKFLVISAFYSEYGDRTQDVAVVPGGFFLDTKFFFIFGKKFFVSPEQIPNCAFQFQPTIHPLK